MQSVVALLLRGEQRAVDSWPALMRSLILLPSTASTVLTTWWFQLFVLA